jgi:hypothetical protein
MYIVVDRIDQWGGGDRGIDRDLFLTSLRELMQSEHYHLKLLLIVDEAFWVPDVDNLIGGDFDHIKVRTQWIQRREK